MEPYEVGDYFPEFFALKGQCKFNNCLHRDEPNCAVKEALNRDELSWSRYKSYIQILDGEEESYRTDIYKDGKNQEE
jgi:ribosome biogenesis GTPase